MNDQVQLSCPSCGTPNRLARARAGENPSCGRCHQPLFPGKPFDVTDSNFAEAVEGSPLPVLVDFWAPWCGPCRQIAPSLDGIAKDRAGKVRVARLEVDHNPRTAARFNVRSIPFLVMFKDGKPAAELVGAQPRPLLDRWVREVAG